MVLTSASGHFLGEVRLGELYLAISFVALIGFPIEAGFNQQLVRDVAQDSSKALRYLTNILCLKLIFWIVLYGCILLLSLLLGYSPEQRTLITICGITLLTGSIANVMGSLHYTFERATFPVIGNILEKGLSALVGSILLLNGASVEVMAYVLLGGSCASLLWQTAWVLRLVGIPFAVDIPLARELLRKSIPFILYGIIGVIYYRLDTILLSLMADGQVVGSYGAGYRIFDTLVFLPSLVISAIMYPVFSKLSAHSHSELKLAVEKSLNFLLLCGIAISGGLIAAAPSLVKFLYDRAEFSNTIGVMQCLAPGLLFLYINSVLTSVMISTGRERKITLMAAIALVFNLMLNLLLIPLYQQYGAAFVTSLTELLLMALALVFLPRYLWPTGSIKVGLKALLAALIMGVVIWFMQQHGFTLLPILPVAALCYFAGATLLGTIPREDVRALYTSIRHKAGRTQTSTEPAEIIPGSAPLLTDEEIVQEQEFVLALGREMTNPLIPAVKFDMTNPVLPAYKPDITSPLLPAYKYEMTHPLLPTLEGETHLQENCEITAGLPNTPLPAEIHSDNGTGVPRKATGPIKDNKRRDPSRIDDDNDETVILPRALWVKKWKTRQASK
jgi:O-antigen/teichoic acid export membrane protein